MKMSKFWQRLRMAWKCLSIDYPVLVYIHHLDVGIAAVVRDKRMLAQMLDLANENAHAEFELGSAAGAHQGAQP